jgi:hypothetical protein
VYGCILLPVFFDLHRAGIPGEASYPLFHYQLTSYDERFFFNTIKPGEIRNFHPLLLIYTSNIPA